MPFYIAHIFPITTMSFAKMKAFIFAIKIPVKNTQPFPFTLVFAKMNSVPVHTYQKYLAVVLQGLHSQK